ncbi:UNVERIFIED_CONTAM: hypothetical protein GTU68_061736, partial [Idotea baltica]|nr:hypothetical protein [Idotea baltica]
LISAFIKSLRGSDANAALYYGFRILNSGEDPRYLFRRLIIFASEDIGNSDPRALQIAHTGFESFNIIGLPEGKHILSQVITYLSTAPKSNRSYLAGKKADVLSREYNSLKIPNKLKNAPTKLMEDLDHGKGYKYPHDYENAYLSDEVYLPEEIKDESLYEPSNRGYEKIINERIAYLKSVKK